MIVIIPNGVWGGTLNPMHGHMGAGRGLGQLRKISGSSGAPLLHARVWFRGCFICYHERIVLPALGRTRFSPGRLQRTRSPTRKLSFARPEVAVGRQLCNPVLSRGAKRA